MSRVITVVWIAPLGTRWGVKHEDHWLVEPDLPQWQAAKEAERIAENLRETIPIVNIKTEQPKKKRPWRKI